jgi:ABC-2 type transport system ATP-binding protein
MPADPVITTDHLTRHFNGVTAVDGLTMSVGRGEVFGVLGHNGAGKTTTVRLLNGVLAPSAGSLRVLGFDPAVDGPALRRRTGVLTETPSLDERMTARENLAFYAELYDVPEGRVAARIDELLDRFNLTDRGDEKVGAYSKGMKQRLALARALIHGPELLFLDEPTAGLDPVAARRVHNLILRLSEREGRTVLLCTHNLIEAQRLCDRVAVLEHGRVLALGTPADLSHRYTRAHRLEIEFDPATRGAVFEALGDPESVAAVEAGRVLLVGINRESVPGLVARLAEHGARIYRVTPDEPTLEDVYFALHDASAAGEVAAR